MEQPSFEEVPPSSPRVEVQNDTGELSTKNVKIYKMPKASSLEDEGLKMNTASVKMTEGGDFNVAESIDMRTGEWGKKAGEPVVPHNVLTQADIESVEKHDVQQAEDLRNMIQKFGEAPTLYAGRQEPDAGLADTLNVS